MLKPKQVRTEKQREKLLDAINGIEFLTVEPEASNMVTLRRRRS